MDGKCIFCVGTRGNGPLQFYYPQGIAINKATGQVYVSSWDMYVVQVLNANLSFSHTFGSRGSRQGRFEHPVDMAFDNEGFVYVADCKRHHIQKFTPEGQFVCSFGTKGSHPGQLYHPAGITIDDNNLVYVCDENDFVCVFNANGDYVYRIQKKCEVTDYKVDGAPTLGVSCTGGNLYVCCYNSGQIKLS